MCRGPGATHDTRNRVGLVALRLALGLGPLIAGADKFYVLARLTEAREAQPASVAVA